ncbi:TetR/AcrR family transcriptional regulator [Salipiger mangrovisoli]|uniref:TetR/AcrR family transcriptional regulator n=1 Tax=Salipiger mangrovisoli TaxID=2865933 RepID=A0ABR9X1G0_9RHOB|nr:TetR/AcrR family transcriptional regulator [Salipiger mangrovisoli]MBE9637373.1 TetR/AcrR family transcriptional regulator [Salipiger mangrovisoli]
MNREIGHEKPTARKPRADQLRNRERLLDAAREVFREEGGSLEAVARTAGLGIGTLYRHFPSREALFQAVYAREVETLERRAAEDGLEDWMRGALQLMATKKGMVAALAPVFEPESTFFSDQSQRLRGAISALHDRAVADGRLRADVTSEDLLRVLLGLNYGPGADPARSEVLLDVFLEGLRAK